MISSRSLTDEEIGDLRSRVSKVELSTELEDELSVALDLAESVSGVDDAAVRLRFIFDCLLSPQPKLALARDERIRLQIAHYKSGGSFSKFLAILSAGSAVKLILSALILSFLFWNLALLVILGFKSFAFTEYLYFIDAQALGVTTSAALIGGIVSIATRIKESTRFRDLDPITTFWTIFLKPLIGVVGAIFLLCVFASDLITVAGVDVDHAIFTFDEKKFDINERYKALYLLWAIGFVAGFSERFAWDFLTKVQARLEPSAVPSKDNPVKV